MSQKARVLLFHIEPAKAKQIEAVARQRNIQVTQIPYASYGQKLGYLAGITGFHREAAAYSGAEFPSEMMVFSGMDSDRLDEFLAAYKKASIPPIGLKAIITPHNIHWSAEVLYRELFQEHQSFRLTGL